METVANIQAVDVLVVGGGIAGTAAALAAAEASPDASVMLACDAQLFSGSSFAGATWGLGCISPGDDPAACDDLARRILEIGGDVPDTDTVRAFTRKIEPAVRHAESWGVQFRRPSAGAADEAEYVACFDDRRRIWRFIGRDAWRAALGPRMAASRVEVRKHLELLDVNITDVAFAPARPDAQAASYTATFYDSGRNALAAIHCRALVLATGGNTSLWPGAISGNGHATGAALAQRLGARLTGMSATQFMPTLVSPVRGVVFNEKAFKFMQLDTRDTETIRKFAGTPLQADPTPAAESGAMPDYGERAPQAGPAPTARPSTHSATHDGNDKPGEVLSSTEGDDKHQPCARDVSQLLAERSTYGPYTDRLPSNAVDRAIVAAGPQGLALTPHIGKRPPELVADFLTWMQEAYGISPSEPLRVTLRAQASNGGIAVDADGAVLAQGPAPARPSAQQSAGTLTPMAPSAQSSAETPAQPLVPKDRQGVFTATPRPKPSLDPNPDPSPKSEPDVGAATIPGLFAAGECAGGMHGRDRIGGLASAAALTFGIAAGQSATLYATTRRAHRHETGAPEAAFVLDASPLAKTSRTHDCTDCPAPMASTQATSSAPAAAAATSPSPAHTSADQASQGEAAATSSAPAAAAPTSPSPAHTSAGQANWVKAAATSSAPADQANWIGVAARCWHDIEAKLKQVMGTLAGPTGSLRDCLQAARQVDALERALSADVAPSDDARAIARTRRTALRLATARAILADRTRYLADRTSFLADRTSFLADRANPSGGPASDAPVT